MIDALTEAREALEQLEAEATEKRKGLDRQNTGRGGPGRGSRQAP